MAKNKSAIVDEAQEAVEAEQRTRVSRAALVEELESLGWSGPTAFGTAALQAMIDHLRAGGSISYEVKATREDVVTQLQNVRTAAYPDGWTGPTNFSKADLQSMLETIKAGGTVEVAAKRAKGGARKGILEELEALGYQGSTSMSLDNLRAALDDAKNGIFPEPKVKETWKTVLAEVQELGWEGKTSMPKAQLVYLRDCLRDGIEPQFDALPKPERKQRFTLVFN